MLRPKLILKKMETLKLILKNTILESTHIQKCDPTLHEVTSLDSINSSDSMYEFSRPYEPKCNSSLRKEP